MKQIKTFPKVSECNDNNQWPLSNSIVMCYADTLQKLLSSLKSKCVYSTPKRRPQPRASRDMAQLHSHRKPHNFISLLGYQRISSFLLYEVTKALSLLYYIHRQHTINYSTVCNVVMTKSIVNHHANMINRSVAFKDVEIRLVA